MREIVKHPFLAALALASAVTVACSSRQEQPDRPVTGVPGDTDRPSSSHVTTDATSNPCSDLAGTAVGRESAGKLAAPPSACVHVADTSTSGPCAPGGKTTGQHWFVYSYAGYTAVGKGGGTWQVKHGRFDRTTDLQAIGC